MKMKSLQILIFLSPILLFSQIHFDNYVECVYNKESVEPLIIYESRNGNEILRLKKGEENCYYKLVIKKTKKGWAKIYKLMGIPSCSEDTKIRENNDYKNFWVKLDNFEMYSFFAPRGKTYISFLEKPDFNSRKIITIDKYTKYQLVETKGLWARVKFEFKGQNYIRWIHKKDQCSSLWIAC